MDTDNSEYADDPDSCANVTPLQLAIRETQETAASPRFWVGLGAVILVLAITAPFDTASRFSFSTLVVYWGVIALCTFFLALPTSTLVGEWSRQRGLLPSLSWLLGGIAAAIPVTVFVIAFNRLFFDIDPIADHGLSRFFIECMLIAVAVVLIFQLAQTRGTAQASSNKRLPIEELTKPRGSNRAANVSLSPDAGPNAGDSTLLQQRLSPRLGDDIVTLQAQDHYVDVTTTLGHEMILMRLSDAERELSPLPGMRVHRSWWVAKQHIASLERQASRTFIVLDTGERIPVSRSHAASVENLLAQRELSGQ